MKIYHFNCVDGARIPDTEGISLPDDQTAQVEAVRFAGEVLQSEPHMLWEKGQWRVEVTDAHGLLLFTVIMIAVDAPKPTHAAPSPVN